MVGGARYSIGAVARMTGVTTETLRAWERRYALVSPARDERGRTYSDADVRKLKLLHDLVRRGHPIGRLAALRPEELEALGGELPEAPAPSRGLRSLWEALEDFDAAALDRELARSANLLTPRDFVLTVASPFLRDIGEGWEKGRLSVAHEHLASSAMRTILGTLVRVSGVGPRPQLVFATPQGERHEFGLLCAALLAAASGLFPVYLGPDLPAEEIAEVARRAAPLAVTLAATGAFEPDGQLAEVRRLVGLLPEKVPLWAGGATTAAFADELGRTGAEYLASLEDFEERLLRERER